MYSKYWRNVSVKTYSQSQCKFEVFVLFGSWCNNWKWAWSFWWENGQNHNHRTTEVKSRSQKTSSHQKIVLRHLMLVASGSWTRDNQSRISSWFADTGPLFPLFFSLFFIFLPFYSASFHFLRISFLEKNGWWLSPVQWVGFGQRERLSRKTPCHLVFCSPNALKRH